MSANDDAAGLSGITYSVDAIEQFQVITSGAQAELGRALGGYVNVVTKSGTNQLRGTVYDFVRDDSVNGTNALSGTKLPMNQSQFGASVGGPVERDRTFFFANVERRDLDQTGLATISDRQPRRDQRASRESGYRGPQIASGIYAESGRDQQRVREDRPPVQQPRSVQHPLRPLWRRRDQRARRRRSQRDDGIIAPRQRRPDRGDRQHAGGLTAYRARNPRANRARELAGAAVGHIGPAVSIAGVAAFGTSSSSPTGRLNTTYQVVNNLSHHRGSHAMRVGADFLFNDDLITFPRSSRAVTRSAH